MDNYYVNDNAQSTGEHEVHKDGCYWLSQVRSKSYLGSYASCGSAIARAKAYHYSNSDGCASCCPLCHTK
ncbi:hypothetical protein EZ444_05480 [Pedobacter hiemivivus]|uniref:Uncharacterized protein n=1 Tax=Pedobacter hiemivivus TaxID=2530454 RepID=A0A4R0NE68_9SPHI|nr:hypothetical protein EZ444_05480 [Pedobacter hiemivivus]